MNQRQPPGPAAGVYAALVTPRQSSSSEADAGKLLDYIDHVEAGGVSGLVLFGSTGEFVHFPPEERIRVTGLAIRRSRTPLLVNVSHSDFASVVTLAESAINHGAAGLMLLPPYFYRYDGATIQAFYEAFAELFAGRLPLYLYNLPQYTNPIPPGVAACLLASGRFAGIKDSSGDWSLFEALLRCHETHHFQLLIGSEKIYRRARLAGANGTVSGVAAALPELITALDTAILSGNEEHADHLDKKVGEYVDWLEKFPATYLIRQTAALRGWIKTHPGLPLSAAQQSDFEAFQAWFPSWHAGLDAAIEGLGPKAMA